MHNASLFAVVVIAIALAAALVSAQTTGVCPLVTYNGGQVDPNQWTSFGTYTFSYNTTTTTTKPQFAQQLSLCQQNGTTLNNQSGYSTLTPVDGTATTFNKNLVFDLLLFINVYSDHLTFHYGSSQPGSTGNFLHVEVYCDPEAAVMYQVSSTVSFFNHSYAMNSTKTIVEKWSIRYLCPAFTGTTQPLPTLPPTSYTIMPPTQTAPVPPPMTTTGAPSPSSDPCVPLQFNGVTVHPHLFGVVIEPNLTLREKGKLVNNSNSYWGLDLCSQVFAVGPEVGYIATRPAAGQVNGVAPNILFTTFLYREIVSNVEGRNMELVFRYGTPATRDRPHGAFASVRIICSPGAQRLKLLTNDVVAGGAPGTNVTQAVDFTLFLGVDDLCPKSTTPAPNPAGAKCTPFQVSPLQTVDPKYWPKLSGHLEILQTGAKVRVLLSTCKEEELPVGIHGYAYFGGDGKLFNTTVFDIFERAGYFPELQEFRARYQSSVTPSALKNRVEITVRCDPTAGALTFTRKFIFSFKNELGGDTYVLSAGSSLMCVSNLTTPMPYIFTPTRTPAFDDKN